MTMKTKRGRINPKAKQRMRGPETIDQPPRMGTSAPHNSGNVPTKLITEQRSHSTQIIEALTKTAVALSGKEGLIDQVAIMERLWAMQKDAEDRQAEREFGIAKVALAMDLPVIPKNHMIEFVDKNNVSRKTPYADRADIESVLDPICRKHGFSKEYSTHTVEGKAAQIMTVRHVSGHKEIYYSPYMPLDTTGSKNNNQAAGSTAEYGKRYALVGAFNIIGVDKDDDGNQGKDTPAPAADQFSARVQEAAEKPKPEVAPRTAPKKLTLPEAAAALEEKLLRTPQGERGATLMQHINILGEMEKDTVLSAKASELRKLAEELRDV